MWAIRRDEASRCACDRLWSRGTRSSRAQGHLPARSISEYVDTRNGLYPAPFGRNAKANVITKIRQKFKFLGKFMAKALIDSRMVNTRKRNLLFLYYFIVLD